MRFKTFYFLVLDLSDGVMRRNVKALINPNQKDNWNSKVETGKPWEVHGYGSNAITMLHPARLR